MKISSISIRDLLGTRWVDFQPGTLTTVTGGNGSGKTSILEALKRIWEGGHDPALLRRGAKVGEAKIVLDDGTTIQVRVTKKSTTYEITDASGNEVKAPRAFIQDLGDSMAVDPCRILQAKPKDLPAILLDIMPVTFSRDELQAATGEDCWPVNTDMTLDQVDALYKQIYDARATANRQEREASATVTTLRASLNGDDGDTDWSARLSEYQALLADGIQEREGMIQAADRKERDTVTEIKDRLNRDIERLRQLAANETEQAHSVARAERAQIDEKFNPDMQRLNTAIAQMQERASQYERAQGARALLKQYENTSQSAQKESARFSAALHHLEDLRQAKLASLPVPGLAVREGEVFLDDIHFERVNLAERIKVAFRLAAARAGKLPFMILDQAEAFDSTTWEAFQDAAKQSGFQIIAARVGDGPLAIDIAA